MAAIYAIARRDAAMGLFFAIIQAPAMSVSDIEFHEPNLRHRGAD